MGVLSMCLDEAEEEEAKCLEEDEEEEEKEEEGVFRKSYCKSFKMIVQRQLVHIQDCIQDNLRLTSEMLPLGYTTCEM